jgi:uncharacterized protein (TIGR02145 family)
MKKNLSVTTYQNGDEIPHVQDPKLWAELKTGAWCFIEEDKQDYGRLYNWYAINDPRGLAPESWKVPSNSDWDQLIDFLGGQDRAGKKLKSKRGWKNNGSGNNSSRLNCLPGAGRTKNGGVFGNLGGNVGYWTATEIVNKSARSSAWSKNLDFYSSKVYTYKVSKQNGFYVRCVKP